MRDFTLPWGVLVGLLLCLWNLSNPQPPDRSPHGVYCGYRPGPTRVMPPSRQDDGTSERQLLRAWFAWLCKCLLLLVSGGWSFCRQSSVSARTPSSTDSLWRGCRATSQTPPVSSHAMLHCSCVLQANRTTGSPHSGDANNSWLVDPTEAIV